MEAQSDPSMDPCAIDGNAPAPGQATLAATVAEASNPAMAGGGDHGWRQRLP